MAIYFYKEFGELGYLANYSEHGFYKDGTYWKTVEHYYQAQKFDDPTIKAKIQAAQTPKQASTIGRDRQYPLRSDWEQVKQTVMQEGVLAKFRAHSNIMRKLLDTGNEEIVENTVKEYYWGCGDDKSGQNNYGKILGHVREILREEWESKVININRLKQYDSIYVIGHQKPDADSIFSSYILTKILKSEGINAIFTILDDQYEYSYDDEKLIEKYLPELPFVLSNTKLDEKNFFLVDHNDPEQSIQSGNVIGCIDHHIDTQKVEYGLAKETASTALYIYKLWKDRYSFSKMEKDLIALTVMSDTEYFASSRFQDLDKKLYDLLQTDLSVDEIRTQYLVTTDFTKTIKDNFYQNYKKYNIDKQLIQKVSFKVLKKDYPHLKHYVNFMKKLTGTWLLMWCEYDNNSSEIYLKIGKKIHHIHYNHVATSTILTIKDLQKQDLLKTM